MSGSLDQFRQVIESLLSADNAVRKQAEAVYNNAKGQPDALVSSLFELIRSNMSEEVRNLCCVLLRRAIGTSGESLWDSLNAQTQSKVKEHLLSTLAVEQNDRTRAQLTNATSELARKLYTANNDQFQWNELLVFMFNNMKAARAAERETSLSIFADLTEELSTQLKGQLGMVHTALSQGLADPESLKVKIAALSATSNFLQILSPSERAQFQNLLPAMLGTLNDALNAKEEEEARMALEYLLEMVDNYPMFLKPYINDIINACVVIISAEHLEDDTHHMALELLISLCEKKPAMVKKIPRFLDTLAGIIVKMMCSLDDEDDWHTASDDTAQIDITDSDVGEETLDRFSLAMGGPALMPIFWRILPTLLSSTEWQQRHTGLMIISIISEGCAKSMKPHLPDIVKQVLPFMQDQHPRVRWAACNAVGQMSTDFLPDFQEQFHGSVLPALINTMDDTANPRVQGHAAAAVINFCESASPSLLEPYLRTLLHKLYVLFMGGKVLVQEQVVTAVAAIADAAKGNFIEYYDTFMPVLKSVLSTANGKEHRNLRGKTMECISLIGGAVGKEKFYGDAKHVMELMMNTQNSALESDDPQIGFLLQSWARICKCMGQDFVPYLPYVMPPLLHSAKLAPEVTVLEADEIPEQYGNDGWEFISVGDQRVGINTSAMEEKSTACGMLYCYANELGSGFFPYVEEVTRLLVPLLKFHLNEGVRSAALTTMPQLINSAVSYFKTADAAAGAGEKFLRELTNFIFPTLLESIQEEDDMEMLLVGLEVLAECIESLGEKFLNAEQLQSITTLCLHVLADVQLRRADREQARKEEELDEEDEERVSEEEQRDEEVVSFTVDCIGRMIKMNKADYVPHLEIIMPALRSQVSSGRESDKQSAICVFDDLMDHLGEGALPYFPTFINLVMDGIYSKNGPVRQAAVFGAGLIGQHGGAQVQSIVPELLKRLLDVINTPDAREETFIAPTENAICAVGKMCMYQEAVVDCAKVLPMWLNMLPVTEDAVESKVTYSLLATFVERQNQHLLAGMNNLPKIVSLFTQVVGTELIDESTQQRIVGLLKQIPQNFITQISATLPADQQQKLSAVFKQ
ncbi:hypothetical protein PROFUN_03158 [Planoprotostelium fungivorum]|uniref:TOG domain-containing protein n=1 Tax=Planoprotostelium fungivorum TaxID=1890364 RepID=A0A2P6NWV8_9EUKA|nr:hypothetical protein PROFUN_03158 [Planoprotostelium fungivorum]